MPIIVEGGCVEPCGHRTLRAMFEARKQVFVDLLKWDVPVLEGRFEVDQFDDEHALYVILAGAHGEHLGSARLLDTRRPHILGTLYPELCAAGVPAGPGIFEITRFCLDRSLKAAHRREIRNRLVSALVGVALERGIRTYTGVAEVRWLQQILAFGWDCRPLGPPRALACGLTGALAITISPETPALLEQNEIWVPDAQPEPALAEAA